MQTESIKKTGVMYRHFKVERAGIDVTSRMIPIAVSSEEPYERWFGTEILDHSASAIDMGRLANGAPLLREHDTERHIGVVESASIGTDKILRAVVRLGKSPEAEIAFQDIQDGILRHVSVGYIIDQMVLESASSTTDTADLADTTYRVTAWEPLEVSFVAVPADPTVGIGRSMEIETRVFSQETQQEVLPIIEIIKEQQKMEQPDKSAVEAQRVNDLLAVSDNYVKYGARDMVGEFIRSGKSVDAFQTALMEKITTRHSDAREGLVGMEPTEVKQYSLLRAINAQATGDWRAAGLERSASEAVAKTMGKGPEGFYIPLDAWQTRDFTVGTVAEAGNLVQTTVDGSQFIDILRKSSVTVGLGARQLFGLTSNLALPKKNVTTTLTNVAETGALTKTQPNTAQVLLSPKRMGTFVEISKQAIIQGSPDVEALVRDDLLGSTAERAEFLTLMGTGAANNPRGVVNQSGIGAVIGGINGLQLNWGHVVGLETQTANANAVTGNKSGYVVNSASRGSLKTQQKAANLQFIWDNGESPLNGYKVGVTNHLPSNGAKGTGTNLSTLVYGSDWSDLIIGYFGGMDLTVDPYTLATTGMIRVTVNQFMDVAIRQTATFSAMTDAITL